MARNVSRENGRKKKNIGNHIKEKKGAAPTY
jgi:hypothetical protein